MSKSITINISALANLTQTCAAKVSQRIQEISDGAYRVGKLRSEIRTLLAPDLASIDEIVKKLVEE